MARFTRGTESVELVRDGAAIEERTAFGVGRRELHDERAALIAYYARIVELITDRWTRTTPFVDDLVTPEEPALVRAIDDGDEDALAVYTDWLIDRGDPRGELAALRAGDDERAIASLEKTRGVELFGPLALAPRIWRDDFAYVWRRGWIHEVVFAKAPRDDGAVLPDKELMHHVLHAPMARFARWLSVDTYYATPIWECLGDCTCIDRIRGVRLSGPMACQREMLDELPALEELELLDTHDTTGGHPNVHRVRLSLSGPTDLAWLDGEWPMLRRLELVVGSNIALTRAALGGLPHQASLRELVVEAEELSDELVRLLVERTAHLDTIEIRARISDAARRMLAKRPS